VAEETRPAAHNQQKSQSMAMGGATGQQQQIIPWKRLKGKYTTFFAPEQHEEVEKWYNTTADRLQRSELKQLVHAILDFDFPAEKKRRLKLVPNEPDIVGANALLNANGVKYFAPDCRLRVIEYLSLATPAEKNSFRNVFGRIVPPSPFAAAASRSYDQDYNPARKYWKPANMIAPCKEIVGKGHLQRTSFPFEAPAEVIGLASKTTHDQNFVWKLPGSNNKKSSLNGVPAAEAKNGHLEDTPEAEGQKKGNPALRTSCGDGAPWGSLDVGNIDGRQWRSVTNEQFDNSVFMLNPKTRHFQNYNENYCRLLSTAVRLAKGSGVPRPAPATGKAQRPASTLPGINSSTTAAAVVTSGEQRPASCAP
jgi:hypothetical protein